MAHALLAVFYYEHQNPGVMMNPYWERSNNTALDDEFSADDPYYYNVSAKFDYVDLQVEHVPFYDWLESKEYGPDYIYAFLTPGLFWFDRWDDAIGEKVPDERFRKALIHHILEKRGVDREELYVNIYDYHC